jgi:hypothetical protein
MAKASLFRKKVILYLALFSLRLIRFLRVPVILRSSEGWASNENCEMLYAVRKITNYIFFKAKNLFCYRIYTVTFSVINCFHSRGRTLSEIVLPKF